MLNNKTCGAAHISFSWNIHYKCNYRCPYCWFNDNWIGLVKYNIYPSLDKLLKAWENIYNKYGSVHIDIAGGEPFIYPDFIEVIAGVSCFHEIGITTNLSCDIESFVNKINSSMVGVLSTFHPGFAKLEDFIRKKALLRERGFGDKIVYLAYPTNLKMLNYYRNKFEASGFSFEIMTFWGRHNGTDYPASYTEEERNIIQPCLGSRSGEYFQLVPKKMEKGRLCKAGYCYAVVNPNGDVYRCGSQNMNKDYLMNNIFNENFTLLQTPSPCVSDFCPCNEFASLLV